MNNNLDVNTEEEEKINSELFSKYLVELQEYYKTGGLPKTASQDLKYILNLRDKKLKKLGLKEEYKIVSKEDFLVGINKVSLFDAKSDNCKKFKYGTALCREKIYYHNDRAIYKNKDSLYFYETIINADYSKDIGEMLYNCPNCGSPTLIKDLKDKGCPYCRTKFMISELFPKVSNYYTLYDSAGTPKENMKNMKIWGTICAIVFPIIMLIACFDQLKNADIGQQILSFFVFILFIFCGFYLGMILYGFTRFFRIIIDAIKNIPLMVNSVHSKGNIDEALKKFDPNYTYAYFESKLVNYLKIILFSEQINNLAIYCGNSIDINFKNLIDINYKQVSTIENYNVVDNNLFVTIKVFLESEYFINNSIKNKDEQILVTMKHNLNFKENNDFTISAVRCKSCGGSFDASYQKHCPYCRNEYHMDDDDWVITNIQKLK